MLISLMSLKHKHVVIDFLFILQHPHCIEKSINTLVIFVDTQHAAPNQQIEGIILYQLYSVLHSNKLNNNIPTDL